MFPARLRHGLRALLIACLAVSPLAGTTAAHAGDGSYARGETTISSASGLQRALASRGIRVDPSNGAEIGAGSFRFRVSAGAPSLGEERTLLRHDGALRLFRGYRGARIGDLSVSRRGDDALLRARIVGRLSPNAPRIARTVVLARLDDVRQRRAAGTVFVAGTARVKTEAARLLERMLGGTVLEPGARLGRVESRAGRLTRTGRGGERRITIRYGPLTVGAAREMEAGHGGHGGHGGAFRHRNFLIPRGVPPCEDCALTGAQVELRYRDGRRANYDTDLMLHHMVVFNARRRDATCSRFPERFLAAGNERTPLLLPRGYGYPVRRGDDWRVLVELMNTSHRPQTAYVDVTYTFAPDRGDRRPVTPVWLDINQCGDSQYSIPAGRSAATWDWTVNVPGSLVAIGGHLHDDGVYIDALLGTSGRRLLCRSRAQYGGNPSYEGHIAGMTGCLRDRVATLRRGQTVRLRAVYDSPRAQHDVMGIMVGYVAPR